MDSHAVLFLKMSGFVPRDSQQEIEKTFRHVFERISPRDCIENYFSEDIFNAGYFHFYSTWISADALSNFLHSDEYRLLEHLCQSTGIPESDQSGELFQVNRSGRITRKKL